MNKSYLLPCLFKDITGQILTHPFFFLLVLALVISLLYRPIFSKQQVLLCYFWEHIRYFISQIHASFQQSSIIRALCCFWVTILVLATGGCYNFHLRMCWLILLTEWSVLANTLTRDGTYCPCWLLASSVCCLILHFKIVRNCKRWGCVPSFFLYSVFFPLG